jgi:hypothetical protein
MAEVSMDHFHNWFVICRESLCAFSHLACPMPNMGSFLRYEAQDQAVGGNEATLNKRL